MSIHHTHTVLLGLAASGLLLAGCGSDTILGSSHAAVRYANAMSGGSGSLVFNANGSSQGITVPYQSYGSCQQLDASSTDFSVMQTGGSSALASLSGQTLTSGGHYTALAVGSTTSPNLVLLTDTYTTPADGRGRLRVVNATGVGNLFDVYIGAPGAQFGTPNPTNVGFGTSPSFIDVPAGMTQVRVTTPGTQTVLGTSANFTVNSGDVTTLVFTPSATVGSAYTSFLVPECP